MPSRIIFPLWRIEVCLSRLHKEENNQSDLSSATDRPIAECAVAKAEIFFIGLTRQLNTVRGHMVPRPLHVCSGLASPAIAACHMYCEVC